MLEILAVASLFESLIKSKICFLFSTVHDDHVLTSSITAYTNATLKLAPLGYHNAVFVAVPILHHDRKIKDRPCNLEEAEVLVSALWAQTTLDQQEHETGFQALNLSLTCGSNGY